MEAIDWSKAPEGATHYTLCESAINPFLMKNDAGWHYYTHHAGWQRYMEGYADDHTSDVVERPSTEWTGTGLPPVGTVCERNVTRYAWCESKIYAHSPCGKFAAYVDSCGMNWTAASSFRPIRTQEQIEAEEREAFALKLVTEMGKDPETHSRSMVQARKIFDLGYRKQEVNK